MHIYIYIQIHIHSISSIHIAMHCSSRSTPIILAIFCFTLASMAIMIRNLNQITADEFCSVIHLNKELKMEGSILLAQFLGLDARDPQWIDSDGRNCTRMCNFSSIGGFSSNEWTFKGWILDDYSIDILREEFPHKFPSADRPMKKARCMHTGRVHEYSTS